MILLISVPPLLHVACCCCNVRTFHAVQMLNKIRASIFEYLGLKSEPKKNLPEDLLVKVSGILGE